MNKKEEAVFEKLRSNLCKIFLWQYQNDYPYHAVPRLQNAMQLPKYLRR